MSEAEQRAAVIAEAKSWLRTPYHHMGRLKGVGADCLMLAAEVYERAGVIPHVEIPFYPPDWHLHRADERMMKGVLEHAAEVNEPGPGDLVLWRMGRALAHCAIVVAWPLIVHSAWRIGVIEDDGENVQLHNDKRGPREKHFFSPWAPHTAAPAKAVAA